MYLTKWILIVTMLTYNPRGDLVPSMEEVDNPSIPAMTRSECTQWGIKYSKGNPLITHFTCKEIYISKDFAT